MNFMLNQSSENQLRELKKVKNLTMSDLLRRAIEVLYNKEIKNEK